MADQEPLESKAYGSKYEPIFPRIKEWPIAKFYQNKQKNLDQVIQYTLVNIFKNSPNSESLGKDLARAYFSETQRITKMPWKVDKPDEKDFWESIKEDTNSVDAVTDEAIKYEKYKEISEIIIRRYSNEIAATFSPKAYHFAKRFLSFGFTTLLNGVQAKNIKAIFDHRIFIQDKIKIHGDIPKIRSLTKKGTVILLPTHFSNLDSIILAWAIHAIGLPAFMYGAGLNLFNSKIVGYFMGRLGAYKLDRRKKNPFYLETLKSFSTTALQERCHSLFFPGGTRSRSGAIENQLKLGLLGTAFEAQRNNILEGKIGTEGKIFVVPWVMSYHFVLEAKSLIQQSLKKENREQYYFNKDEFHSQRKILHFVMQLLRKKSSIYLSFGEPTDLFGNKVDEDGKSWQNDQEIDIKKYFITDGELKANPQRESVYTKQLGDTIVEKYLETNIVLSSHLVAHIAYKYFEKKYNTTNFFDIQEQDKKELTISRNEFITGIKNLQQQLFSLEKQSKLKLSQEISLDIELLMNDGIGNVGVFHNEKPLKINSDGDIFCESLPLLYYYHNRLNGYDFESFL